MWLSKMGMLRVAGLLAVLALHLSGQLRAAQTPWQAQRSFHVISAWTLSFRQIPLVKPSRRRLRSRWLLILSSSCRSRLRQRFCSHLLLPAPSAPLTPAVA